MKLQRSFDTLLDSTLYPANEFMYVLGCVQWGIALEMLQEKLQYVQ